MRHGYAIFCDDIRHEVSGKRTIVGAYGGNLIFRAGLDQAIPKFCIEGHLRTELNNKFQSLKFIVEFPDRDPIIFDVPDLSKVDNKPASEEVTEAIGPPTYQEAAFQVEISPFLPEKSGVITVKGQTETETLEIGRLGLIVRAKHNAKDPDHNIPRTP